MEAPKAFKQIIKHLEQSDPFLYLVPSHIRSLLSYPLSCCHDPNMQNLSPQLLSIDCQMVQTQAGLQVCLIVIIDQQHNFVYNKWFKPHAIVVDYLTHITGIDQSKIAKQAKDTYSQVDKKLIGKIIANKIVVGHDLANDFKAIGIQHNAFIDTLFLYPHNMGLPYKTKLKYLAKQVLNSHIQYFEHDPLEDAEAALDLAVSHMKKGKGIILEVEYTPRQYKDAWQILKELELDLTKVHSLFLRGSRALGIQIDEKQHKSDWDYICIYDTPSEIKGRLLKLQGIDVSFYDVATFQKLLENNDISYLEIFSLPQECVFLNQFKYPTIDYSKLRSSLGFHLHKATMKIKKLRYEPGKQWKVLKAIHMKMRFIDNFKQILQFQKIVDIKRLNPLWQQIKQHYLKNKEYEETYQMFTRKMATKLNQVDSFYKKSRRVRREYLNQHYYIETDNIQKRDAMEAQSKQFFEDNQKQKRIQAKSSLTQKPIQFQQIQRNSSSKRLQDMRRYRRRYQYRRKQRGGYRREYRRQYMRRGYRQRSYRNRKAYRYQSGITESSMAAENHYPNTKALLLREQLLNYGLQNMEHYHISYRRHEVYRNLIQFHYKKSANFKHKLCRQARGIILDQDRNYKVVCYPYNKFFDFNDPTFNQIGIFDFQHHTIFEKYDGSIASLYHYANKWHVASSRIPDGCNSYCFGQKDTVTSFRKEFWKIFHQLKYTLPQKEDYDKTFIFELLSKDHIIVVGRTQSQLILHGVRNINTLAQEDHLKYAKKYGWKAAIPLEIEFKGIQDLSKQVNGFDALKREGAVLCDRNFTRIKVKSADYVRINWLGELNQEPNKNPSRYILTEIVLQGQSGLFCQYCPEWAKVISGFERKIKQLNEEAEEAYIPLRGFPQKQFAQEVKKHPKYLQCFLFGLHKNEEKYKGKVELLMAPKRLHNLLMQYKNKPK